MKDTKTKTSKSIRTQGVEWKVAAWALRHPAWTASPALVGAGIAEFGPTLTASVMGGLAAAGLGWYRGHPDTFDALAAPHLRAVRRRWMSRAYVGGWWKDHMTYCGLNITDRKTGEPRFPRILRVRSYSPSTETVYVKILPGQTVGMWADTAEKLAGALGAERVAIEKVRSQVVAMIVQRCEPFTDTIMPPAIVTDSEAIDLSNVYLGETEFGTDWTAPLLGQHWLISGVTGSGKGSPIWMMLRHVAPLIRDGLVRLHIANPKGTEMRAARCISYRYAETGEDIAALIEQFWSTMEHRKQELAAQGLRTVNVSRETPLHILLIDELGAVTGYSDSAVRRRVQSPMAMTLSQARSLGGTVVGALQEPTKDVIPQRDLFTFRVQMRAATSAQPDMVLGEDMRKRGALADEIPNTPDTAGIGFAVRQRTRTPVKVRAAYPTDADNTETIHIAGWPHTTLDTTTGAAILPQIAGKDTDDDALD